MFELPDDMTFPRLHGLSREMYPPKRGWGRIPMEFQRRHDGQLPCDHQKSLLCISTMRHWETPLDFRHLSLLPCVVNSLWSRTRGQQLDQPISRNFPSGTTTSSANHTTLQHMSSLALKTHVPESFSAHRKWILVEVRRHWLNRHCGRTGQVGIVTNSFPQNIMVKRDSSKVLPKL